MAGVKASRWRSDDISILYKNNHVEDDVLEEDTKGIQKKTGTSAEGCNTAKPCFHSFCQKR